MATEDNKSGGIFPNFSHLLVLVLAGALFASQNPYHEQRPDKSNFHRDAPGKIHDVDARLWQDPFEAALLHEQDDINEQALNQSATINHKIANQHLDATITVTSKLDSMEGHKIEAFANDLENRLIANQAKQLDVIAVMLPGGAYSEESELRRRIRYAVLSGLYATKQYQSEDAEHIRYFLLDQKDNIGNKAAYEWVVDRSKNHNPPFITKDNKPYRVYDTPQDHGNQKLVIWLDNRFFGANPHTKLNTIFRNIRSNLTNKKTQISVKVLGPFNSEMLFDLVNDLQKDLQNDFDAEKITYDYLSPNATIDESIVVKRNVGYFRYHVANLNYPLLPVIDCMDNIYLSNEYKKLIAENDCSYDKFISSFFDLDFAAKTIKYNSGKTLSHSYDPIKKLSETPVYNAYKCLFSNEQCLIVSEANIDAYIKSLKSNVTFKRITKTDSELADAMRDMLKLRGIDVVRYNDQKIILLSEWDTLYGRFLPESFCNSLIGNASNSDECQFNVKSDQEAKSKTDKETSKKIIYYGYLQGLDGEKIVDTKSPQNKTADVKDKSSVDSHDHAMEDADGDSQFDYIRRLTDKLAEDNKQFNKNGQGIKAIGILGSDVYDKLLMLEALHEKFPDVIYFTNGMDARYLHPNQNKWARNLIVASSYDLQLLPDKQNLPDKQDSNIQTPYLGSIPPFRDSTQTAYFAAAQQAVMPSNIDLSNSLVKTFEIGRTQYFDLYKDEVKKTYPDASKISILVVLPFILLWFNQETRYFATSEKITIINLIFSFFWCFFWLNPEYKVMFFIFCVYFVYMIFLLPIKNIPDYVRVYVNFISCLLCLFSCSCVIFYNESIIQTELFSLSEGVSLWPSIFLCYVAILLGSYFLWECWRFPKKFEDELLKDKKHFNLKEQDNSKSGSNFSNYSSWQKKFPILFMQQILELHKPNADEVVTFETWVNSWRLYSDKTYRVLYNCLSLFIGIIFLFWLFNIYDASIFDFDAMHLPESIKILDNVVKFLLFIVYCFLDFIRRSHRNNCHCNSLD